MRPVGLKRRNQKGFALIYVTFTTAFVLIPMAGLAIDFGMLYNIKARLQTACDAAAIGAGYMLHETTNLSDPTQVATITNAAQRYFNANYPTHYFGSSILSYSAVPATANGGKQITVQATASVPMLLMKVLGINWSQVSAIAVSNVKYIAMMIVVDRSGSVQREGENASIVTALNTFVASSTSSYLVDGTDTVGMISFGGTSRLDFAPTKYFRSSNPNIGSAINAIPFDNSSTNTGEGLYQAWTQLYSMNLPGAFNVILLLTDGRPSSFTGQFTPKSSCNSGNPINGVLEGTVGVPFPPSSNSTIYGLLSSAYNGIPEMNTNGAGLATPNSGCQFALPNNNVSYNPLNDFTNFPSSAGPYLNVSYAANPSYPYYATPGQGVSTQHGVGGKQGYYDSPGTTIGNKTSERYASFNFADNIGTLIRTDTTLQPTIFVIGITYNDANEEPLDPDFLARLANDPTYLSAGTDTNSIINKANVRVYQTGQTPGFYCQAAPTGLSGLTTCFQAVTSHLLRLSQ